MNYIAILALVAVSAASTSAPAKLPWIGADSEINFDATGNKSEDYERRLKLDAVFRFEAVLREGVKAVVKMRIEQTLREGGHATPFADIDWAEAIEDAYIRVETDKLTGLPRAIVTFGKHEMAFGSEADQTPIYRDNLLNDLAEEEEVIGVTVELPVDFFEVVDTIAMSVYETGSEDFQISKKAGGSIQLKKEFGEYLEAQVSALIKQNEGESKTETRASAGFVLSTPAGYKLWVQGLYFDHNPEIPDTTWGAQIGGSTEIGPGTVIIDWEYLSHHAHELTFAYSLPLNTHLVLAPEVRFRHDLGGIGADETRVGVRTRLSFSNRKGKLKGKPGDDD